MRERGWREAGVTKLGREDSDRTSGPMEASGLDGLGGVSGRMNGVLEGESDYEVFDSGGGVCDETVSSDGEFSEAAVKGR